jgi:hypothetical protein
MGLGPELILELLLLLIPVGIVAPIVVSIIALKRWHGGWKLAGTAPLAVVVLFFAPMIPDWMKDPSSHNLWGLVFIPVALLNLIYTVVVLLLRRRSRRPANST